MLEIFVRLQSLLATREKGATAVEYGLMVALIAIVIITAVGTVGDNLVTVFEDIAAELTGVAAT
ncbi:Flp family type IVb pilin [Janibacter sp. DB-40]|uniref:Flp family type IVb pilin n=1 Tax=Janibacter sp. DB-40 TaxID=3028808 RepID=UPI002404EC93|nr:Flp family type IVb pilin [Janibacter sp. DB-40]